MITNGYAISYLLLTVIASVIALTGITVSITTGRKWNPTQSSEAQYALEKLVYLVITLVSLAFFIRIIMLPLWFWALKSFIPSIPGAMCLTGVHMIDSPYSFLATALKFIIPMAYIFWLVVHRMDRRIPEQPLMRIKLFLLIPIGLILLFESYLDIHFLLALRPVPVSCCTSLFDNPAPGTPEILTASIWFWVVIFYIVTVTLTGLLLISRRKRASGVLPVLVLALAILSIVSFLLALHTKISPLFLRAPFHHCVFCLWERVPEAPVFTGLVIVGSWLAIVYALIWRFRKNAAARDISIACSRRLINWSAGLLIAGMLFLAVRLWLSQPWKEIF